MVPKGAIRHTPCSWALLLSQNVLPREIGGQFHEDRMKELQKVKHVARLASQRFPVVGPPTCSDTEALIEMAHEEGTDRAVPAGKSMSFYMSTAACINRVSMSLLYSWCWWMP